MCAPLLLSGGHTQHRAVAVLIGPEEQGGTLQTFHSALLLRRREKWGAPRLYEPDLPLCFRNLSIRVLKVDPIGIMFAIQA